MGWTKISRDRFYKIIGRQDVTLSVVGDYPYKTIFKLRRDNSEIGFVKDRVTGEESEYYLLNQEVS